MDLLPVSSKFIHNCEHLWAGVFFMISNYCIAMLKMAQTRAHLCIPNIYEQQN